MKMPLIHFSILLAAAIAPIPGAVAQAADPPDCIEGTITQVGYNEDDTLSVFVNGSTVSMNLYTSRWNLQPLLFAAFALGKTVLIKTTACTDGGGFAAAVIK